MGVVYQARHNLTGQIVALKLIMPETATTRSAIDRFQREMSVISQLRHPNIVECYEQGMTRGQFWFAMEYVAGTNLETLAKAEPAVSGPAGVPAGLPDPQGARASPSARVRTPRHQAREYLDRRIARRAHGQDLRLRPGQELPRRRPLGADVLRRDARTIPFMPPEQMLDFKTVTPLADLYATAATLYYLLTCQYIYDDPAGAT